MLQRIKNMLGSFMQRQARKKNVLFLLWILLCLSVPLKSAYATCSFVPVGQYGYNYGVCTSKWEAVDYAPSRGACASIQVSIGSDGTGVAICEGLPVSQGGSGSSFGVYFGSSTSCGLTIHGGILECCAGNTNPCCGKKINDPCCKNPDDPICKQCNGTGSGNSGTNASGGY